MKSFIDVSRPMTLYLSTLGLLMLVSLVLSNAPHLALSTLIDIPHQRYWAVSAFIAGALLQSAMFWLHGVRSTKPWKVSRAHVTALYLASTALLFTAVSISK
jgi:hypothetical protein